MSDSETARQLPKFPWDYDVPSNAFWNSLDHDIARAFLSCYTESEISQMIFDESLAHEGKLQVLRLIVVQTLDARIKKVAPALLSDVDHVCWSKLKMALGALEHALGNVNVDEAITREIYQNGPNGGKDMSALYRLSGLFEETGRYSEAEVAA